MPLWSERILVAVPEGHALAEREPVHWIDLREEKILLSRRDPGPELHDETCARLGVFGAFCALWLFIVAERRGALAAVGLAVAMARICQAAARIREQRLIL
jgi:DNA-binding transcriptional LysR family regulator